MPERQDQRAGTNAVAIQAAHDVHLGYSAGEVGELLKTALAPFLSDGLAEAKRRIERLEAAVLPKFAEGGAGRVEALADPDFQGALRDAGDAFARSGEDSLLEELATLLVERSKETARGRRSLVLNQAIKIAGLLTKDEILIVGLNFSLIGVHWGGATPEDFAYRLNKIIAFNADLDINRSAYQYLEAIGVGSINNIIRRNFMHLVSAYYQNIFSDSFTIEEFNDALTNMAGDMDYSVARPVDCLIPVAGDDKFRMIGRNDDELRKLLKSAGVSEAVSAHLVQFVANRKWSADKITAFLEANCPSVDAFIKAWDESPIHQMTLTAVGMALGHSRLCQMLPDFPTPLEIWIS